MAEGGVDLDVLEQDENSGMEEEEEPLFADDIFDDPPPLPPPMPNLAQLNSSHHHQDPPSSSGEGNVGGGVSATQPADADTNDQGPPLKKRKPILTLTVDRIFSDKGLPYIESEFPKLKFKGKGQEVSDLKVLMEQYEHWANRLYPKLIFKDVAQRIERLSTTKEFKNQLLTIRRRHIQAQPPGHTEGANESSTGINGETTPPDHITGEDSRNEVGETTPLGHTPDPAQDDSGNEIHSEHNGAGNSLPTDVTDVTLDDDNSHPSSPQGEKSDFEEFS